MTPDTTMEASVRRYLHERRQLGFALKDGLHNSPPKGVAASYFSDGVI